MNQKHAIKEAVCFYFALNIFCLGCFLVGRIASANVVGADTQNFNPTTNGLDFVTVHSSETLEPGILNLGLFLNYAVNSLPNYEDKTTQSRTNFSDALLSSDLNFGLGLMNNWDFGVSFPMVLNQDVDSDLTAFRGEYAQTGLTEIRINTKYRVWGASDQGVATVASVNFNQIEDNPFAGDDPGPTFNLELVADTTIDKVAFGGNIGYRWRNPGERLSGIPVDPYEDQYIASTAVSYLLTDYDTKLIGEIFAGFPAKDQDFASDRDVSSMELLVGIKTDITRELAFHAGAGTELLHGTSSPDWRVYTGINWVMGPLFGREKEVIVKVPSAPVVSATPAPPPTVSEDPFEGAPTPFENFVARDILFKFNSDELEPEFANWLKRLADYVRKPPGFKSLTVEGHTDSVGSDAYNLDLSQRRANVVRKTLVEAGLTAEKVKSIGYGETQPIADNGNYQGRAKNRRVEFKTIR